MYDKIAEFPLERFGLANHPLGHEVMGTPGWKITVGDVLEARKRQNEELKAICKEFNLSPDGDAALLKDRILQYMRQSRARAENRSI